MTEMISILGTGVCSPDSALLDRYGLRGREPAPALLPAALRRRASEATKVAVTAAHQACREAAADTSSLPSVFASVGGEIQVTDTLCLALPNPDGFISPTQFHNSVHNTTAGYWTIINRCSASTTAIAAGAETVAMAFLEAWCLLQSRPGDLLVACYDETWPDYLAPPLGGSALASAFVLSNRPQGRTAKVQMGCPRRNSHSRPFPPQWEETLKTLPIAATLPLLQAIAAPRDAASLALSAGTAPWSVDLVSTCSNPEHP